MPLIALFNPLRLLPTPTKQTQALSLSGRTVHRFVWCAHCSQPYGKPYRHTVSS